MGAAAAFSFYPGKNLRSLRRAGAITTNDSGLADRTKMIRDHGRRKNTTMTSRATTVALILVQAGWLTVKLRHLEAWNESRRSLAQRYHELLSELNESIVLPREADWTRGVYHLYVVRVQDRDSLQSCLAEAGIGTGIHYPIPLHLQKAYAHIVTRRAISR